MAGECHAKGKELGIWFDIQCVKDVIIAKEAKNQDASYERSLLKSWGKYEGWEDTRQTLLALV